MLKVTIKTLPKAANNSSFLTHEAKLAFLQLKQAFTKAPISYHFDPKRSIQIETNTSIYTIGSILSKVISESNQWYPIAFFFKKMVLAET